MAFPEALGSESTRAAQLLFDLDGTLTDPAEGLVRSYRCGFRAVGLPVPDEAELRGLIGPSIRTAFGRYLGDDSEAVEQAVTGFRSHFALWGWAENRPFEGVVEELEVLRQGGLGLRVVTSKPTLFARRVLNHFNLDRHFDGIHGCELDGRFEDKAELIGHLLGRGLAAGGAIMVGDREQDVRAAAAHGLPSVGVHWGFGDVAELEAAGATHQLPQLHGMGRFLAAQLRSGSIR